MATLPMLSGAECIAALGKLGYRLVRQRGSHVRLAAPGRRPITVPLHSERDRGTLRSILRCAEVTPDEFVALIA